MVQRLTVRETHGARRSYSYLVEEKLPLGKFSPNSLPDALLGEVELLSQGSSVPPFLYSPSGNLIYEVTEES